MKIDSELSRLPMVPRPRISAVLFLAAAASWFLTYDISTMPVDACLGGYRDRWFVFNVVLTYAACWSALLVLFRPVRTTLSKLMALHIGPLLVLGVGEAAGVFGWIDYQRVSRDIARGLAKGTPHDTPFVKLTGKAYPDLKLIMHAVADPIPYEFQTDRFGMRNSPDLEDPRLICVGDSILVAGLVPTAETVTARLQSALGVEVMNASTDGASPQWSFEQFARTGVAVSGRSIVQFVFEGNDLSDSELWIRSKTVAREVMDDTDLHEGQAGSSLFKELLRLCHRPKPGLAWRRSGLYRERDGRSTRVYFYYSGSEIRAHLTAIEGLGTFLASVRDEVLGQGGKYAVVLVPDKSTVLLREVELPTDTMLDPEKDADTGALSLLHADLEARRVPALDLRPALCDAVKRGTLPFIPADTHLNSAGHKVMADAIAPWLVSIGLAQGPR